MEDIIKNKAARESFIVGDDPDVVTLMGQSGDRFDFIEIAGIAYQGNFYSVLQPARPFNGMADDEAVVFKIVNDFGNEQYLPETDKTVLDGIFREYRRLCDELDKPDGEEG